MEAKKFASKPAYIKASPRSEESPNELTSIVAAITMKISPKIATGYRMFFGTSKLEFVI